MKNLMDGLMDELNRNRELLVQYKSIGSSGGFGVIMLETDIKLGEEAIIEGDVVEMVKMYARLKDNE